MDVPSFSVYLSSAFDLTRRKWRVRFVSKRVLAKLASTAEHPKGACPLGICMLLKRTIYILRGLPFDQTLETLFHELIHATLGSLMSEDGTYRLTANLLGCTEKFVKLCADAQRTPSNA